MVEQKELAPEKQNYTFARLVEDWKSFHLLTIAKSSRQFYENKLPYLAALGDIPVARLDVETIDELVKAWVSQPPKRAGRMNFDRELTLLTVVLNFYKSRKDPAYVVPVRKSHYEGATVVRKAECDIKALTEEELGVFLVALKREINPQYYPLALLQFSLALRIGEACGLQWQDFDFENDTVMIRRTVVWDDRTWEARIEVGTKNGRARHLGIPLLLKQALLEFRQQCPSISPFLFQKEGEMLNRKSVGCAYNRVLKRLGLTHVSGTHFLRRTAATQANDLTGDFFAVSQLLDHSSPKITERYVKKLPSQKRKMAEALNGVLKRNLPQDAA